MVRHWTLTPAFTGSSPVIPAKHHEAFVVLLFLHRTYCTDYIVKAFIGSQGDF